MLIFVNPSPWHQEGRQLEERFLGNFNALESEAYHHFRDFVFRLKHGIHDIRLVVISLLEKESIPPIEAIRPDLMGLNIIFIISKDLEGEQRALYAFYPRIVLGLEDENLLNEFVRAKIGFGKSEMKAFE